MKIMKAVLFSMLVLVMGCATSTSGGLELGRKGKAEPNYPSLLIQNIGIDVLRIYENGRRIASVYPGREECVFIRSAGGTTELSFGSLARHGRWVAAQFNFNRNEGWAWIIDASRPENSTITIFPTKRCD